MARKPLIAGNWKMYGSLAESATLVASLAAGVGDAAAADMLICPPFVYAASAAEWIGTSPIKLGAQNLADRAGYAALTGEVSGAMLRDVGCRYVIVGHSERRAHYAETDAVVAAKFQVAQEAGLIPIVCVGETLEEREAGRTESVILRQLNAVLDAAGVQAFAKAVVAYEPVWAIGTGKTATPDQAQSVHAFIRRLVADRDATIAAELNILYGGSVKGANARDLLAMPDIDGGLVGGASLNAAEFLAIYHAAAA